MTEIVIRILDFETSGIDPATARVVEVATVDVLVTEPPPGEPAEKVIIRRGESWSTFVNPGMPIPCEASAVHDITDDMVVDAPAFDADMAAHITRGPPAALCAHNRKFDMAFFKPPGIPFLCTYKIALWLWPDSPVHTNACLRYFLKLKFAEDLGPRHRALGDATVTAAILRKAFLAGATFEQMAAVSEQPAFLPRFTFGKHAMKPVAEIEAGYLEWVLKQKDMDDDVRFTAFEELNRRRQKKGP